MRARRGVLSPRRIIVISLGAIMCMFGFMAYSLGASLSSSSQRHAPQAHRHDPQQPPQQQPPPPPPPLLQEGIAGNVPLHPENAENDGDAASALPPPAQLPPDKGLAAKTQFILSRAKQALGKTSGGGSPPRQADRDAAVQSSSGQRSSRPPSAAGAEHHDHLFDAALSSTKDAAMSSSGTSPSSASAAALPSLHNASDALLSHVDLQIRAVANLCTAEFREQLRAAVHGRSHSPMPRLEAVSAAMTTLRVLAEQNAEARSEQGAISGAAAVKLSTFEFGCFDLSGTVDGVLWKIFSEVGFAQRKAVALVSETEWRHAVTNLAVFADFEAIIIGTSVESHSDAEAALSHPSLPHRPLPSRVSLVDEFASKENINHIISCLTAMRLPRQPVHCTDKGMSGSIDLLVMDVGGGMDYWILDKITEVKPRVIVVKILPEMATQVIPLVRPYKMDYASVLRADRGMPILTAAKWAANNGYRVVGCDSGGGHAFLLLHGLGQAAFPSIDPHACAPTLPIEVAALKEIMSVEWKLLPQE